MNRFKCVFLHIFYTLLLLTKFFWSLEDKKEDEEGEKEGKMKQKKKKKKTQRQALKISRRCGVSRRVRRCINRVPRWWWCTCISQERCCRGYRFSRKTCGKYIHMCVPTYVRDYIRTYVRTFVTYMPCTFFSTFFFPFSLH